MICERVGYFNFRNIIDQTLYFSSGLNIICGNNAQGKTNALEGIWVCSSGKSHRASKDSEMIRFDNTEALIGLDFRDNSRIGNIEVKLYSNGQKVCRIDGFSVRKRSEFIGRFKSVLFTPENLSIVKEGPSERRLFLDNALCLLYSSYISNLQDYNRILKQRNRMLSEHAEEKINLKDNKDLLNEFDIWSEKLAEKGEKISEERYRYTLKLNEIVNSIFSDMTQEKEKIRIEYKTPKTKEEYISDQKKHFERELILGTTLTGVHKDDLKFTINDKEAKNYGSQGQQRSIALALKLSEGEIIKEITKEYPVFLFDDILSELDDKRQDYVLSDLKEKQVILTVCNNIRFKNKNVIFCENGKYKQ